MNCDGLLQKLRRLTVRSAEDPRGARRLGADVALQTSHEGGGVKRALHLPNKKLLPPPHGSPG